MRTFETPEAKDEAYQAELAVRLEGKEGYLQRQEIMKQAYREFFMEEEESKSIKPLDVGIAGGVAVAVGLILKEHPNMDHVIERVREYVVTVLS